MCVLLYASILLTGCKPAVKAPVAEVSLLEDGHAASWKQAGIPEEGLVYVKDGLLTLAAGRPMTGATFPAWQAPDFPVTDYALSYEALRVDGDDFFGTVTFPVGSHEAYASFVLGGWGGTVTGISSIDFADANENATRAEMRFEKGRWYRVRIEVRPDDLRAWVDGRLMVNVSIKGRKVGLRPGFIDHCVPFGFSTYGSTAQVRKVVVERL